MKPLQIEQKPFKGYFPFFRCFIPIFQSNVNMFKQVIDMTALGIFIAFLAECDWDPRHPTFGMITKSERYLATRWGCDISTVYRRMEMLRKLGLFEDSPKGYFKFVIPELLNPKIAQSVTLLDEEITSVQELIAATQKVVSSMRNNFASKQLTSPEKLSQSFNISSKSSLGLSDNSIMTEEDKDWIKQNLKE